MGYYVQVENGVNIYVEDINPTSNKAILFLHGWPASHEMFEYQFDHLPAMGYRCIGIDTRGFGKSDRPWDGYSYDRLADDVRTVIDMLGLENITLVGHSMGGAISIRYMARHRGHKVAKLVLAGAAAPIFTQRPDFPYGKTFAEVNSLIEATYKDRPKMLSDFGDIFFARYLTKGFIDWFHGLSIKAAGHSTIKGLITLRDEDLRQDLPLIQVATLIMHGKHDQVCPFVLGELMHQSIQNSTLIPFEHSGHGLFYCEKEKFNEELAKFVG